MTSALLRRVDAPLSEWQHGIVFEAKRYKGRKDGGASVRREVRVRQQALHDAVAGGPNTLADYLRERLGLEPGVRIGAPVFLRAAITAGEYVNPPLQLEMELGEAWSEAREGVVPVTPRLASQPAFWLLCHIEWIAQRRFGAGNLAECFMAAPNRPDAEGRTRNFLRRTGGIFVRGKTSVFSDCTLARAWWRYHLSREVSRATGGGIPARHAHFVFHSNRPAWETLVRLSVRRLVVINEPRARAAIVRGLSRRLQEDGRIHHRQVQPMAEAVARLGLRNSLAHVPQRALEDAVESKPEKHAWPS